MPLNYLRPTFMQTKRLRKYVSSSDEEDSEEPMIPHRTTSHIAKTEAPEATQSKDKRKPKHSKVEAVETRHKVSVNIPSTTR